MSNDLCDCLYAWEIDELFNNLTANIEIIQLFVVDFRRIRLCAAFLQHLLSYSWPFFLHNRLFQSPETIQHDTCSLIWGHHSQANFSSFCVKSCGDGNGHNYNFFSEAKWARLVITSEGGGVLLTNTSIARRFLYYTYFLFPYHAFSYCSINLI